MFIGLCGGTPVTFLNIRIRSRIEKSNRYLPKSNLFGKEDSGEILGR